MEKSKKHLSLLDLAQDHADLKRSVRQIQSDLRFQMGRADRAEREKAKLERVFRQMMLGLSVKVEQLSQQDVDRKFNHLFEPVLKTFLEVWRRNYGKPLHKSVVAEVLERKLPRYSFLTFYRRMELLADPRIFNPPFLIRTGRGEYTVNWKVFQQNGAEEAML